MPNDRSYLADFADIPVDRLVQLAVEKLRQASLDELGAILSGTTTLVPTTEEPARMIVAIPDNGSKLDEVQNAVVLRALAVCGENQSAAARLLGLSRKALLRKRANALRRWRFVKGRDKL